MASEDVDPSVAFLLNSGKEFDVVILARSTEKALQIIMPWCQMTNTSHLSVSKEMQSQALVYAKAIDFSVDAAHLGFAVCEDALALVDCIRETTSEQRRDFLEGVKALTQQGLAKAVEARNGFIRVRTTVESLLERMKTEDQEAKVEYSDGFLDITQRPFSEVQSQLSKGINDLEKFSEILFRFVAWWNELAMETNTQLSRENTMVKWKIDNFHLKAVEAKWKDHRGRYAAYVNEISIVQDRYPKLFNESKVLASPAVHHYEPPVGPPPAYNIPVLNTFRANTPHNREAEKPERTKAFNSDNWKHFPGLHHRPTPVRSNSVIISEDLSSTSYMSATLASVQVLEPNICFIMLQFQCHPSQYRRFNSLRIKWRLKTVRGGPPSKMIDVAPKQAIGARNEESHHRKLGFTVPAQFNMAGFTAGPEVNAEWQMRKKQAHAMIITGSVRGHGPDAAEWTIEENASAMTGIPPHFCVAVVVQYEGLLMMELDVLAKQRGTASWWSSRNQVKEDFAIDVEETRHQFPEYKPSFNWRTWFPLISGEVIGGVVNHEQEAVARN